MDEIFHFHQYCNIPPPLCLYTLPLPDTIMPESSGTSPLLDRWCNVHVHLSSNCCNNSLEHLKSMPIISTISSALHSTVFTMQYCPFKKVKQNSSISISSCWAPWALMCFKISPCFKACCLIQSWVFKYVNKVKNGKPYSYAISLLLHFYHMTTVFPLLYYWCYFSSLHSHSSFPHYVE